MSLLVISLLVLGAALVAAKVYFQYKDEQALKNQNSSQEADQNSAKTNEQIISERLAEIAEFEAKVAETIKEQPVAIELPVEEQPKADTPKPAAEESKPKAKKKKRYYHPKKVQPKIKAQNKQ